MIEQDAINCINALLTIRAIFVDKGIPSAEASTLAIGVLIAMTVDEAKNA